MILTTNESEVLERIRIGMTQTNITRDLGWSLYVVGNIVSGLVNKSALQRLPGNKYKVLADAYDISDDKTKSGKLKLIIPEEMELYIRGHYRKIPRKELARRLNLDKVTLNNMILQLGIGGM